MVSSRAPIWQSEPLYHDRDHVHKPMGFTRSVEAYANAARKEVTLLMKNQELLVRERGYGYTWAVTINLHDDLLPSDIGATWKQVARVLRQELVAYFVREPTEANRVHYHFIVSSDHSEKALNGLLTKSKPRGIAWHTWLEPIQNPWSWANYILKARIAGEIERGGKSLWTDDIYASQRLLFVANLPFNKIGVIGDFWRMNKAKLWSQVVDIERRIAEGLEQDGVGELCEWLYNGYFGRQEPLVNIQRSIGLHAHDQYVQDWIAKMRKQKTVAVESGCQFDGSACGGSPEAREGPRML